MELSSLSDRELDHQADAAALHGDNAFLERVLDEIDRRAREDAFEDRPRGIAEGLDALAETEREERIRSAVRSGLESGEPDPVPETPGSRAIDDFLRGRSDDCPPGCRYGEHVADCPYATSERR